MREAAEPYRGADRRRTSRPADDSVAWVVVGATVMVAVAAGAASAALAAGAVPSALGSGTAVALLRAAGVTGAVVVGVLLLEHAALTGEAAPRLIGVAVLLLAAVAAAAELPGALGAGPAELRLALRAGGLAAAAGLLVAASRWPVVDAGLRARDVALAGVGAAGAVAAAVGVAVAALPAGGAAAAVEVALALGLVAAAVGLLRHAVRARRRLFAVGGLLLAAWALPQLPLVAGLDRLAAVAAVLEALRLLAIAVGGAATLDDLEDAFVAQRHMLLAAEVDRRSVEARLQARHEHDRERAHEARSALSAIEGASARLARYRAGLDEDGRVALSSAIQAEIERLQHLVDSERPAERQPLRLAELAHAEAALARQQGTTVHVEVGDDAWVLAERDAVLGILRNLLVNARTHASGSEVRISAHAGDGGVELRVADDGPGLGPEELDRVFERGERGPGAERRPGSGLGLHVARRLAERNDGTLTADSEPGRGARFVLRLPSAPRGGDAAQEVDELGEVGERRLDVV